MLRHVIAGMAGALLVVIAAGPSGIAQGAAALSGTASSQAEGKMEGVVVTARGDGATFDVTVVSDAEGRYTFPRTHLPAGKYSVKIRAVGYDLTSPGTVDVSADKAATLDLTLAKTKDLSSQITSQEWLNSVPGTDEQKSMVQRQIASCTYCHSLERVIKSRHTAEQFVNVIHRMSGYYFDGTMAGTEGRGRAQFDSKEAQEAARKNPVWGFFPGVQKTELAAYLATVNRSGGRELPELKTLPRPKGKATRVIITQWDMPRKDTVPHDSDVDSKGQVWYTDQSRPFVGRLDPKTGTFKEWPLPAAKNHEFTGGSDIQVAKDNTLWFPVTSDLSRSHFGLPIKFDPQTEQFTWVEGLPQGSAAQFLTIGPSDGKIYAGGFRIDPKTAKLDETFAWNKAPNLPPGPHAGYEPAVDSKGNYYITDFGGSYIVRVDAKTKEAKFFKTPTVFSQPRRGRIDDQDRYWFGEYTGDSIAMFDTKTEKFQEWNAGKWSAPYTSSIPDKSGRVYAPSNTSDRVLRLDPKTGEIVAYLMPTRDFDVKQMSIDPIGGRAVLMANVRNARIVRVEPLD